MWQNFIIKNRVVLYSILLSLFIHIIGFFIFGKLIIYKKQIIKNFKNSSSAKVVRVSLTPLEPTAQNKKQYQQNVNKKAKKIQNLSKKLNVKKKIINTHDIAEELDKLPVTNIPENVIRKKISKLEKAERSAAKKMIISRNENNQGVISNISKNKSSIKIVMPDFRINKKPIYPRAARIKGYEGTVYLKISLSSEGKVIKSVIKKSSGFAILDKAALKASLKWHFKPAYVNGVAIPTTILVPVTFKLSKGS